MPEPQQDADVLANAARLMEMINSTWMAQALRTTAELGLADLLEGGPRSAADLAVATETHEPSLHRLLRALVTIDVVTENADGTFALTPAGLLLRKDAEATVRSWAIYQGRDVWDEWGLMLEAIRTGRSGRELANDGNGSFEPVNADPRRAETFNSAMAEGTRMSTKAIVAGYDFSRYGTIADIGGGYGQLIGAVLAANPDTRGILFDLPHAIDRARPHLERTGVLDRCTVVAGSFFDEVPAGADLYVLKSVIHDWPDDKAVPILESVRRAMAPSARLMLIERLMPEQMRPIPEHRAMARTDMNMLVAHAAPERTEGEWRLLLDKAGFTTVNVAAVAGASTGIEAEPRKS